MFLIIYSYLLSNAAVTREIEDNVDAKFWGGGVNKVNCGLQENVESAVSKVLFNDDNYCCFLSGMKKLKHFLT